MQNGHANGTAPTQQVNINPREAALFALQFIEGVAHTRAQRETYDIAVSMLQAIATGQVVLAPPPAVPTLAQVAAPDADKP